MKRTIIACLMALTLLPVSAVQVKEKMNLSPVAVTTQQGVLVTWRYRSADGKATYTVKRNGTEIAKGISTKTNYLDAEGKAGDTYEVVCSNGSTGTVKAWSNIYKSFNVKNPGPLTDQRGKLTSKYTADDISAADLDGDGEYEIVMKWMSDSGRDNKDDGYTTPCVFTAYKLDGTPMWGKDKYINLGYSIRSGNHYSPFLVYDLDGDGKAEFLCKTGPDSKDAQGNLVTKVGDAAIQAVTTTDFGNGIVPYGKPKQGEEFLTVFSGATGEALNTIWYCPGRDGTSFPTSATENTSYFGDDQCNKSERYNACVAYLDGQSSLPTAIMERGYYAICTLWAVDYRDGKLATRWLHKGTTATSWCTLKANGDTIASQKTNPVYVQSNHNTYKPNTLASSYAMGVHSIAAGDVNGDGYDDICIGSATIGHDGKLMCSTGLGHGDAMHLADLVPGRPGLELMMPHEEKSSWGNYGWDVHDATTGEILCRQGDPQGDTGRGLAGDFIPSNKNSVCWAARHYASVDCETGDTVSTVYGDMNYRIYWNGDPFDQTFDGGYNSTTEVCNPRIKIMNNKGSMNSTIISFKEYGNPETCNGTKATPGLQADILGDWREELIMYNYSNTTSDSVQVLIYSTPEPTEYKVPCLMEDNVYRLGIVWQNCSYNQPPHLGYDLANSLGIDRATYETSAKSHATVPDVIQWNVSNSTYQAGQELSPFEGFVSVTLGNGTWKYHDGSDGSSARKAIYCTSKLQSPTLTDNIPTEGSYIVVKPSVDCTLSVCTYSSQNNCNVVMVDSLEPTKYIKNFRQKAYYTNMYDVLKGGHTYYIYATNFSKAGNLDNLYFQNFTARLIPTIVWQGVCGSTVLNNNLSTQYCKMDETATSDYLPKYILYNNKYYCKADANFQLTQKGDTLLRYVDVPYTESDAVAFTEAEASGVYSRSYGTGTGAKYSMGKGIGIYASGYLTMPDSVEAGTYKATVNAIYRSGTSYYKVKYSVENGVWIDATENFSITKNTSGEISSATFTLPAKAAVRIYNASSSNQAHYTDYAVIRPVKKGDVNFDGYVNAGDINAILNVMTGGASNPDADVNDDTYINSGDINAVLKIMTGEK